MKIIIIRHGETEENKKGLIQGYSIGGNLSENGILQAKKVAERLKNENIDAIYTSDLKRAIDTANYIQKISNLTPIFLEKKIRERNWGNWEGKFSEEIPGKLFEQPDIETINSLLERTKKVLDKIYQSNYKTVLISTHGGAYHALVANILNCSFEESLKLGQLNNTAVTIFDPSPLLKIYACVKHLN